MERSAYIDKISSQLNNELHYNLVSNNPTISHFSKIREWCEKWLGEGQISQEIADWVLEIQPKPGVAFGNIKTYKEGNPLRLITSCCCTAIERISALTEFYLKKSLAQKLPSFLKDTTDSLINKIDKLNEKGPLPPGTFLVSWDIVAMFPNIDNCLGLSAVKEALDSRSILSPSTDCI